MKELPSHFKSGFVSIIGKPNVGKSTLINRLIDVKIAIISSKPQTTRNKTLGILTDKNYQIVFSDTPGIHKPLDKLGEYMVKTAKKACQDADLVISMIDVHSGISTEDKLMFSYLVQFKTKAILVLNKIDILHNKSQLLPMIDEANRICHFLENIPISVISGENLQLLLEKIIENLPESDRFYSEDEITDRPERFIVAEFVREKIFELTYQEIPYSVSVNVDEMKQRPGKRLIYIKAIIYVEKASQKSIIIGKDGQTLKQIGSSARQEIEKFLNQKVFLELWVKIMAKWRKDKNALKRLGYI